MSSFKFDQSQRMPLGWNITRMLMRGRLTDRKIAKYEREGYYSAEIREYRRKRQAQRQARRDGSFDRMQDGRLIFRP